MLVVNNLGEVAIATLKCCLTKTKNLKVYGCTMDIETNMESKLNELFFMELFNGKPLCSTSVISCISEIDPQSYTNTI